MSLAASVSVKMFVFVLFCLFNLRACESVDDNMEKIGKRVKRSQIVATAKTVLITEEKQGFLPGGGCQGHKCRFGKVLSGCKDAEGKNVGYDVDFTRHFHGQCHLCHCVRPGVIAFRRMSSCKHQICGESHDAFKGCKKIIKKKGSCCRECDDKQFILGPATPAFTFPPFPAFTFGPLPHGGGGRFTFPPIEANGLPFGFHKDEANNDQSKDDLSPHDI